MIDVLAIGESSKSDDEGKIQVALKVRADGRKLAMALAEMNGRQVEAYRQSGELIDVGIIRGGSIKKRTKEQEDDEIDATAKIVGSKNLQKCVGLLIKIDEAKIQPDKRQPRLPATEKPERQDDRLCSHCGHPWARTKNPRRDKDGHGRQSGECYVVGCKCQAWMPPSAAQEK